MNTTVSPLRESARTVQLSSFQPDELFFSITDDKGVFGASTAAGVARLYTDAGYAAQEALPMAAPNLTS